MRNAAKYFLASVVNLLARPFRKRKPQPPTATLREQLASRLPDASDSQRSIIESVTADTMTSPERILALCEAVSYICQNKILGDIVECGVWKGGSMAAIARTLESIDASDRQLWMYDTFEGMSSPTENDVDFQGQTANRLMSESDADRSQEKDSIFCECSLESVKATIRKTGYPEPLQRYVKGKVENTLAAGSPDRIAILRLDTDWYESTRCELEQLFPKLVPGGVLIIDDYGHWQGCRKAVDEYFAENNVQMFLHRVDYTGRLGIKMA